jgi:hypothetical protein
MFDKPVYLIMHDGKAYYSFYPSIEYSCWVVNNEIVMPWLTAFPELMTPKTIH